MKAHADDVTHNAHTTNDPNDSPIKTHTKLSLSLTLTPAFGGVLVCDVHLMHLELCENQVNVNVELCAHQQWSKLYIIMWPIY